MGVFDPSSDSFTTVATNTGLTWVIQYFGGVVALNGNIYFVPNSVYNVGVLSLGNQDQAYTVENGVPQSWLVLLSPYFNKI